MAWVAMAWAEYIDTIHILLLYSFVFSSALWCSCKRAPCVASGSVLQTPNRSQSMDESNPPSVPEPWQPIWDDEYACFYYYHTESGETTWLRPSFPSELTVQPCNGWIKVWDPNYESFYFFNVDLNKSTWDRPSNFVSPSSTAMSSRCASPAAEANEHGTVALPSGAQASPTPPGSPRHSTSPKARRLSTSDLVAGPAVAAARSSLDSATGEEQEAGFHFPAVHSLPPPPPFKGVPKVYPSVVTSRGMLPPRFMMLGVQPAAYPPAVEPPDPPSITGFLHKKGVSNTQWKRRFFALQGRGRVLRYYKSDTAGFPEKPLSALAVYGAKIRLVTAQPPPRSMLPWGEIIPGPAPVDAGASKRPREHQIAILPPEGERVFHLAADSQGDMMQWLLALLQGGAKVVDDRTAAEAETGAEAMLSAVHSA
mgnify:CR=1 FL=1